MLEFTPALLVVTASVAALSLGTEVMINAVRTTAFGERMVAALDQGSML